MKTLTTFVLGLILAFFGLYLITEAHVNKFNSFWDYIKFVCGIFMFLSAYNKIEKSTI